MASLAAPAAFAAAPADAAQPAPRLGGARLAAFASIAIPIAGAGLPLTIFVPQIYASQFGLPLTTIGLLFLAGRLWDAFADPFVGALSDATRTRFGRRRPWIAAGGIAFGVGSAALFFPRVSVSALWLGAALFVFYLGWTMIEIPFSAWVGELSGQYHERTRIVTYQTVMYAIGLLLALVLPTILDQLRPGDGILKLHVIGGALLVMLVPALLLSLNVFREPPLPAITPAKAGVAASVRLVFGDRLLLRVLAADLAVTCGQGVRSGLIVFFVVHYMGLPAWASGLYLLQFVFGVLAGPIWLRIGYRIGKTRAAIAGEIVQAAINLALLLVVPGGLPLLLALTVAQGLAQGSGNLMLRAMVADVADAHELRTGHQRSGLFFSVFTLSTKAGPAIAIGIALPLVAWLGFDPAAAGNASAALDGLKYVFALGPALAHLVAAAVIHGFPLDQAAHAQVRAQLDARSTPA